MFRSGEKVGDRFVLIEQIGGGGMGAVWRARHVELDVDVALKAVNLDGTGSALARFKREAQVAARLRSPNVVQVMDFGVHDEQPYLAMELLHGEDLAARLARRGKLPLKEVQHVIDGVARAAEIAHAAGLVHRDLKPANIFLERVGAEEIVKVLDFGLAKNIHADPKISLEAGVVVGSPAYMSPEQVWAEPVDHRTDLWSMAVVAFEMLTGVCPFQAEALAKTFERIIREPLPKIRAFAPELPATLEGFFERALARSPADRFATASELARELRTAIGGSAIERERLASEPTMRAPSIERNADDDAGGAAPRSKPRWGKIALLAAGALAALGAFAFVLRRPEAQTAGAPTQPPVARVMEDNQTTPVQTAPIASIPVSSAPPRPDVDASVAAAQSSAKRTTAQERRSEPTPKSSSPRPEGGAAPKVDPTFGIPVQ